MQQQQLNFTGQGHAVIVAGFTVPINCKEEPLVHARQVGATCAYYALAILMGMPPAKVLECGKRVLAESRLRTLSGGHDLLAETYRRLGYVFPYEQVCNLPPIRADKISPRSFSGLGIIRVTKRPRSNWGHLVAYKAGTVYDSALDSSCETEEYLLILNKRGRRYLRVIPEKHMIREGDELTTRERDAQEFLKKRPRRTRRVLWY